MRGKEHPEGAGCWVLAAGVPRHFITCIQTAARRERQSYILSSYGQDSASRGEEGQAEHPGRACSLQDDSPM